MLEETQRLKARKAAIPADRVAQAHHTDFPMAEAITHRFAIEESQQALEAVERQETIKALIVPA